MGHLDYKVYLARLTLMTFETNSLTYQISSYESTSCCLFQ